MWKSITDKFIWYNSKRFKRAFGMGKNNATSNVDI